MLRTHLDTSERILLETSKIVQAAGHSLHKGTPREAFIRDFLGLHLAQDVGIGTGELFDSNSQPGDLRNQIDVVLYQKSFPQLHFGGGISGFLSESVISTIEIKSEVNRAALKQAITASSNTKALQRNFNGPAAPTIYSYVVGYQGPASMNQIYEWICDIHVELAMADIVLPPNIEDRVRVPSHSVDVVVILGLGILYFDTSPIGVLPPHLRAERPEVRWIWIDQPLGNLLFLFLHLIQVISLSQNGRVNLLDYLRDVNLQEVRWGTWVRPPH